MSKYTDMIPDKFAIHELVPKALYEKYGDKAILCLDPSIVIFIAYERERWGVPLTINNYAFGGRREWSTLRTPDSPWYNPLSQHSFARALDTVSKYMTAQEMRDDIKSDPWLLDILDADSITIEEDVDWLHIDFRIQPHEGVFTFTV